MTGARRRMLAIVLPIVSSSLAFLAWSQVWVTVILTDGRTLAASGDVAAPAIPPLAIAALALVGALALAGLVFRVILGVLQALLGLGIAASGVLTLLDPVGSAIATITAATGVEGVDSVRLLVDESSTTLWPAVAVAAGLFAVVVGVGISATASRWPARTRRYDAVRWAEGDGATPKSSTDRLDTWDALSDGNDPTAR
jgi:uncharacterized membrane protein (TIGR02234 family)